MHLTFIFSTLESGPLWHSNTSDIAENVNRICQKGKKYCGLQFLAYFIGSKDTLWTFVYRTNAQNFMFLSFDIRVFYRKRNPMYVCIALKKTYIFKDNLKLFWHWSSRYGCVHIKGP